MRIVVDASVALKWVFSEPGQAEAATLLDEKLLAPHLMLIEASNALWLRVRRGELLLDEAQQRLKLVSRSPVEFSSHPDDLASALGIAAQLGHPVYDCTYLAMAVREDAELVTADQRFLLAVSADATLAARVRPLV